MSGGHPVLQLDEASTYLKRNWRTVYQTWNWVIFTWCETRVFPVFEKSPKCKTYIWNAEMTKVIVRCLLLDWNHQMSVHAMNFYFYLWLLKIRTPLHTSRHLEFIIEHGHRVNWVSGSLDSRVTGSQNVTQFHVCYIRTELPQLPASIVLGPATGTCHLTVSVRLH